MLVLFALVFLLPFCGACSSDSECGSGDYTQPGVCLGGVCQCGFGYAGNRPVDPQSCSLQCVPPAIPDAITFLNEPNVTVTAAGGNLVLDVSVAPFLKQKPSSVAFLNPSNGTACRLMPEWLGQAAWTQSVDNAQQQCFGRSVYAAPFAATVSQACWVKLAPTTEAGSQYRVEFNQYRTQVEVIEEGVGPFGQIAARKRLEANETVITRAFRRDYTISVATSFTAQSSPFTTYAANVTEPTAPTAVDDRVTTTETVAVTIDVLANDVEGTNALLRTSVRVTQQASHGTTTVLANGEIRYAPTGLYHGSDTFEYEVCDNTTTLCSRATVEVTVLPDGPVANDDAARVENGGSVSLNVVANDVLGVGGLATVTIVSAPSNGTATSSSNNNGTVVYTAEPGFAGVVSFEYEICDASVPTALCARATVLIDVGGVGPICVSDQATVNQSATTAVSISVLANDLPGTAALNTSSLRILSDPTHGTITTAAGGVVNYLPSAGYHGSDEFVYEVCDLAGLCSNATVSITVVGLGPRAVDDAVQTAYLTRVTVNVLANDVAGAQPLVPSSVRIVSGGSSNGVATVLGDGRIQFDPASGFTGSETIEYEVCDDSTPTAQCARATLTVVVLGVPAEVVVLRYRLVTIDYDVLGNVVRATVQTQTPVTAKIGSVALWNGTNPSTGIAALVGSPATGAACDARSPAGFCDQYHVVTFAGNPCSVQAAELVLSAEFRCAGTGGLPSTCGYTNARTTYRLDRLILTYDACPRVVEYGINTAASYLHLNTDAARTTVVADPQQQGTVLYGRCAIEPSAGASFETVRLVSLNAMQQTVNGAVNLGNQLTAPQRLVLLSPATQNSPTSGVWDFDLTLEAAFFSITETYYLEATIDLTFANTGTLTKRLVMKVAADGRTLRAQQRNVELVAVSGRAATAAITKTGVVSERFNMRAATTAAAGAAIQQTSPAASSGGASTGMIAGIAAAVGAAAIAAAVIVAVVVRKRMRRSRASSDAPLVTNAISEIPLDWTKAVAEM